ncbi:hypothetical protein Fot_46214 [Forsythia ovata]|uniref:Uncharacterized protein n=1 Tax=Forsythia ovata TaxID=205694 RepID=A0ABD1QLT1_9LAMI
MGICASSHLISKRGGSMDFPPAKVVHLDGRLQEFQRRIAAEEVLSLNPNCFICSSDTMYINSPPPQMAPDDVLKLGQIYFLMPISKSQNPISLQDLCALAIKASKALHNSPFLPTRVPNCFNDIVSF